MIQIPKRWEQWVKTLLGGAISGGANAGLAAAGLATGSAVAPTIIHPLDYKQIGAIFISGALVGAFTFLAKSPVPPDSTGDTSFVTKQETKTP